MKQLRISYHSFVDIITNSSTELFVSAGANTITGIKDIVNQLLKVQGSTKTADDLFIFELVDAENGYGYKEDDAYDLLVTARSGEYVEQAATLNKLQTLFRAVEMAN
jgi:hypothetical protein